MLRINGFRWPNQKAIRPVNQNNVKIAQNKIENTMARANQRLENALQVDGIEVTIFLRTLGGNVCTCCGREEHQASDDVTGNDVKDTVDNPLKIIPVQGEDDWLTGGLSDPVIPSNKPDEFRSEDVNTWNGKTQYQFSPDELAELNIESDTLFGGDGTSCGICYGTGRTQGYSLYNGQRFVLAANTDYSYHLFGAILNTDTKPYSFLLPFNKTYVSWDVEFPYATHNCLSVVVKNNREVANGLIAEYSEDNKTWNLLTPAVFSDNVSTKKWQVRVRAVGYQENAVFTHVEINIEQRKKNKGQTQNLDISINMETADALIVKNWVFSSHAAVIPRESVFYDYKYGYMWKVNSVTNNMDTSGQNFSNGFDVKARILQKNEKLYPLKYCVTYSTPVNFDAIEKFQGNITTEDNNQINKLDDKVKSWNDNTIGIESEAPSPANIAGENDGSSDVTDPSTVSNNPDTTPLDIPGVSIPGYYPLDIKETNTSVYYDPQEGKVIDED